MSKSKIEWCDRTWEVTAGCTHVSEGCRNCYAERLMAGRLRNFDPRLTREGRWTGEMRMSPGKLEEPLYWRKPQRVFVCSRSDLFHPSVPFEFIDRVFAVMALCPQHTFQVLTKRPERMAEYINSIEARGIGRRSDKTLLVNAATEQCSEWPLPNVWLGTSVEDQAAADARIWHLLRCPAAVRFLSVEPMLGLVDLNNVAFPHGVPASGGAFKPLDWVICGGESGPGARPMRPNWARFLRNQCAEAGVPFYFKQWGEWAYLDLPRPELLNYNSNPNARVFTHEMEFWSGPSQCAPEGSLVMNRVGKKAAGCLLDGVEHKEFPR